MQSLASYTTGAEAHAFHLDPMKNLSFAHEALRNPRNVPAGFAVRWRAQRGERR